MAWGLSGGFSVGQRGGATLQCIFIEPLAIAS